VPACPNCGQENPRGFKFCGACGSPIVPVEPPPEEERKVVTALFTDIVGSTASAEEMDPEDVRARLAPYYSRLRTELESFGGTVEKFIGDAVVALFGAPLAHEDDPERAVRAALAINRAVQELNEQDEWLDIHIRTAVHTGEALVVVGAKAAEGEGMAAGDVMNTAARLQGGAPVDGIAVGEATFRATEQLFEYEEGEPVKAKGKTEPIPIWVVVREKEAPERPAARAPLVGRRAELDRLTTVWQQVLDTGRPRLVNLLGPPGIGKSRLLLALSEHVEGEATVHWGHCLSYGEGMTYWPLVEIIKSAAGIRHDDTPETDSVKLGRLLESLPTENEDELRTMAAALANLIGIPTTPRGTYSAEAISQAELHWSIRRLLPLLAQERPLLLVFEDLHWAEPTLLELLRSLPHPDAEGGPFLVVGTARPELAESEPEFVLTIDGRESHSLEPLGEDEIEQLLSELLADTPVDSTHIQRLVRNAGGNPLFLEETVRMVAEAKDEADLESLPVPDTVQALIGARLDNLPGSDKRVAQQASVVGSIFWPGAVAYISGVNGELQPSLDTLERRDFVRSRRETTVVGEQEYEFKHILIRDVAYERLPKGRRAELHARFIEWIRDLGSEDEFVEIEAHHLEQACVLAASVARAPIEPPVLDAIDALKRSAEKAERREGLREADRFYTRGLELLNGQFPEASLELRLRRGATLVQLGHLVEAERLLAGVAAEAEERGRLDLRCAALVELGDIDQRQGRAAEARGNLVDAGELANQVGDRTLEIRAVFVLAALKADFDGAYGEAIDDLRGACALIGELESPTLRAEGNLRLAALLMNLGRLGEAEHELKRCLDLAGDLGSRKFEAEATCWLGQVRFYRGQSEEAAQLSLQARDWLERTADTYFQVQNLVRGLAVYELARDDPEAAERWLQEALPIALEIGGWVVVETYRFLTAALLRQGRLDEARELVGFAQRNLPEEDLYARAGVLLAEAAVHSYSGGAESAVAGYEEALGLLAALNMEFEVADTRLVFARALRRLGEEARAREELKRARTLFLEMQAEGVLAEVERELAEIAEGAGPAGPLVAA
jgi:class 3 adenylate cyclase/tetratricopeptide (TPR) repeat protein